MARVRIEDLLREVDSYCHFAREFRPLGGYEAHAESVYTSLLAALIAHGTNLGIAAMGLSAQGVTVDMLQHVTRWFLREDTLKAANAALVNYHHDIDNISRYSEAGPGPEDLAMVVEFQLNGQDFMGLNGTIPAGSEGQAPIAMFVSCDTQDEVDELWDELSAGEKKLQCGWLKDKYGIPWNIVPQGLGELLGSDDRDRAQRAMQAMLKMEKLDINELRRAHEGAAR